ncbi:restriction endonuclease subunit S [Bifidobacterium ramosum]|uniref:restriction endonuclease subunit S n=1 Tax=Bifidobacterium ramosum TaxID=1798158 RepID=UPI001EF8D42F|nr:restriction endonuclease subunit S [Bifidobacterium ramosum]
MELARSLFLQEIVNAQNGWGKGSLTDIANYRNGLAMQKFRPEGHDKGLPVLKIRELREGKCSIDSERCKTDIAEDVLAHDGDVIFSWSGSLLIDLWAGGDAGLNQHLFKVTSAKYPKWFYYLWTDYYLPRFISMAADKATTMGHIKRSALENTSVAIPSSKDFQLLNALFTPIVDKIISSKVETIKLAQLRDALLPKLMSGEIDVSKVELPTPPAQTIHANGRLLVIRINAYRDESSRERCSTTEAAPSVLRVFPNVYLNIDV